MSTVAEISSVAPAQASTSTTYKVGDDVEVVEATYEETAVDGTYLRVQVYASRLGAAPTVGDLVDTAGSYTVTIDKA